MTTGQKPQATQPPKPAPAPAAKTAQAPTAQAPARRVLTDAEKAQLQAQRAAKFRQLGNQRLNACLKRMKHLENLGRGQYVYTTEQADTILRKLTDGVAAVKIAFAPKSRGSAAAQEIEYL